MEGGAQSPPGAVTLEDFRLEGAAFVSRHRTDIEGAGLDAWLRDFEGGGWSSGGRLWTVRLGGGGVGAVGYSRRGAEADLGLYLEPGSRRKKVGFLATVAALARLWGGEPGAPAGLIAPCQGIYLMPMREDIIRLAARAGFRRRPCGRCAIGPSHSDFRALLAEVCAPLRACRRALAWALVRATRQASPHPFAAFLRRHPGLLHVVGRRVLAYWCYPADIYHRHYMAQVYHLQYRDLRFTG